MNLPIKDASNEAPKWSLWYDYIYGPDDEGNKGGMGKRATLAGKVNGKWITCAAQISLDEIGMLPIDTTRISDIMAMKIVVATESWLQLAKEYGYIPPNGASEGEGE